MLPNGAGLDTIALVDLLLAVSRQSDLCHQASHGQTGSSS